ncbi:MAG: TonB-dependent receptor [Deltaproteobacteria bacterium]|jgi:outer membrane receptor protein involved in Fe transport|nr:TonB-dependent receptor [Deltaproteobacteria bacterium]
MGTRPESKLCLTSPKVDVLFLRELGGIILNRLSIFLILSAALGTLNSVSSFAQSPTQDLPAVVIAAERSANFTEEEKSATTNNITIDQKIIQASMAENLSELLTELGFATEAAPTDYDENVALMRGFGTEHLNTEVNGNLLILINGRRSGIASTRQIVLDNVERVEIIRGPEMYKYSMGSPGGVINVITRRGGPSQLSGTVKFGAGSYKAWKSGLSLNGLTNNFDYNLGYTHSATDDDYKDGDGRKVHNTKTEGTDNVFLNIGYTFNNTHRIGLDAFYYRVDKAHQPSYRDDDGDVQAASYANRESKMLTLTYEGSTDDRQWSWNSSVGYSNDLHEIFNTMRYPRVQEVKTKLAKAGLSYSGDTFDMNGGVDFVSYDVQNAANSNTLFYQNTNWRMTKHDTSSSYIFGAYLTGKLKLIEDKLNISGGVRFERAGAKDKSVGDEDWARYPYFNSQGITRRDQLPAKRSFSGLSPSLGVSYQPVEWLNLRANYTKGWRAPSGRQLFASFRTEGYGAGGDPRLKPEKTDSYEIGFDIKVDHFNLSGTYFFEDIRDFIYIYYYANPTPQNPNGTGRVMRNVDKRYQAGFEAQTSVNVAGLMGYDKFSLTPYLNLTHMTKKEEQIKKGGPGLDGWWWPITRMPDTVMNFGLRFAHFDWHFTANLNFVYNGLRLPGRGNAGPNEHYNDIEFGKTTVVNLILTKRLWEFANNSSLNLKVNLINIFDKVYSYRDKIPDTYAYPGRNFYATVSYNF